MRNVSCRRNTRLQIACYSLQKHERESKSSVLIVVWSPSLCVVIHLVTDRKPVKERDFDNDRYVNSLLCHDLFTIVQKIVNITGQKTFFVMKCARKRYIIEMPQSG